MNYPNRGANQKNIVKEEKHTTFANRGMDFEKAINSSNTYYDDVKRAIISKRPTPIHIVKVDYKNNCRITDAYFEKQSNADYNGVYRGKYIDFEAKETKNTTRFPLANIHAHQYIHLENIIKHGGIGFFIISFTKLNEVYIVDASIIIEYFHKNEASIPYTVIKEKGHLIKYGYPILLEYLKVVDQIYFNEEIK